MALENKAYLDWIRSQPCFVCDRGAPSHAHHHTGRRGLSQRAHDHDAMPLCHDCHRTFHAAAGRFRHLNNAERLALQDSAVAHYRAIYTDEDAL